MSSTATADEVHGQGWLGSVQPLAERAVQPFTTNAEIRTAYEAYLRRQVLLKHNTRKTVAGLLDTFDVYVRIWPRDFLVTRSNSSNFDQFVTHWAKKCKRFQAGRNGKPSRCLAKQDLGACPMLKPGLACSQFKACLPTSIEGYLAPPQPPLRLATHRTPNRAQPCAARLP